MNSKKLFLYLLSKVNGALLLLFIIGSGCNLQVDDGEKVFTITTGDNQSENTMSDEENGKDEIFEEMNFEIVSLGPEMPASKIRVLKVDPLGLLGDEVGEFDVIDRLVYVPKEVKLKGFLVFELYMEDGNLAHSIMTPGNTLMHFDKGVKEKGKKWKPGKMHKRHMRQKKHEDHLKHKMPAHYHLGHREILISDQTMRLVREFGYPLGASYHFVLKHGENKFPHMMEKNHDDPGMLEDYKDYDENENYDEYEDYYEYDDYDKYEDPHMKEEYNDPYMKEEFEYESSYENSL